MKEIGRRGSVQPGASTPCNAEEAGQSAGGEVDSEGASFAGCDPVTIHRERTGPPMALSVGRSQPHAAGQICTAPAGKHVLAQAAMVRIIVRFLTVRELLAFSKTAHSNGHAVAAELGQRSTCLDAQYTLLFDEFRSLNAQYAELAVGTAPVDQLRAIRVSVKAMESEMDKKLKVWEEIQHAWRGVGISAPEPVLTRGEGYLD